MIGKVKTGQFFKGVLDYNKKGEIIDKTILADQINKQVKEFKAVSDQNSNTKNKVKHFILSFSNSDSGLDDFTLTQIGREYLSRMGYENNQYITYKHSDTDHLHLHIVANRIKLNDGKAVKDGKEKYRSRDVIKQLEDKYNLTKTPRYNQNKATKKNTQAYKAAKERLNKKGDRTDKQILKDQIGEALSEKPSTEQEFFNTLKKQGIEVQKNKAGNGYNFTYNGRTYKASNIHRSYSFNKLNNQFEQNKEEKETKKEDKSHLLDSDKPLKPFKSNKDKNKNRGM